MKPLTFALLCCFPVFLFGQNVDSLNAVIEMDSLIKAEKILKSEMDYPALLNTVERRIDLIETFFYTDELKYAGALYEKGTYLTNLNKVRESEVEVKKALLIWERLLDPRSKEIAKGYFELGRNFTYRGEFTKAEENVLKAISIYEKIGTENIGLAQCHSGAGTIYRNMGMYEVALTHLNTATDLMIRIGKAGTVSYAYALGTLGNLYSKMGDFKLAEESYFSSLEILQDLYGEEHPICLQLNGAIGGLYMDSGRYESAEKELTKSLALYEKAAGKENLKYTVFANNLANLYITKKDFAQADSLLLMIKGIYEKMNITENNYNYAIILENIGEVKRKMGKLEEAEFYFEQIEETIRKTNDQGKDYGDALLYLSLVATDKKEFEKARGYLKKAINIFEKTLGTDHQTMALVYFQMGKLYLNSGEIQEAVQKFLETSAIQKQLVLRNAGHFSEYELLESGKTFQTFAGAITTVGLSNDSFELEATIFDNYLFYKNFIQENSTRLNKMFSNASPETVAIYNQWKGTKRLLATEYSKPLSKRKEIEKLEEKMNREEKELAKATADFLDLKKQVSWKDLKGVLKEGEAIVEFIYVPDPSNSINNYAALILRHDDDRPILKYLFEEKSLDTLFLVDQGIQSDYINDLYKPRRKENPVDEKSKKDLASLVWQPVESEMKDITKVYYSPAGLLHRINLSAISIDEKVILGEKVELVQVNSSRQLITPTNTEYKTNNALLYGGIQYNMDSTVITNMNDGTKPSTARGGLYFSQTDNTLRGGDWNYLDWTEVEVLAIESILQENGISTRLQNAYKATEETFKAINKPSPRILHIATHGFFFPDPEATGKQDSYINNEPIFKVSDHPMIRSGLIMAGANHAWETGKPFKPNMEDGILTAYEISQMDLSNTELVVLSACDTGLGDIQGNEGVYGLQRAFKIAGAKYLIMSLWQVPDYQTQQLMTTFYNKWLTDKMSIPDAFRSAQQEMQEKYKDPFLWAGFVLVE